MHLEVLPVLESELEAIHRFKLSADRVNPIEQVLFPNGASEISVKHFAAQDLKAMRDPKNTSRHVQVKDVDTGDIVSYAQWSFIFGEEEEEHGKVVESGYYDEWPVDSNHDFINQMVKQGKVKRNGLMKGQSYACT